MAPDRKRHKYNYENRKKRKYSLVDAEHDELKFPPKNDDKRHEVSDLVYEYLAQVSNVHNRRKLRKNARSVFHRTHLRKQHRNIYPNRRNKKRSKPKSTLDFNLKHNLPLHFPLSYNASISQFPKSAVSKKDVNNYAKAVNEGRNIVRKYVCKALLFGLNSGFLIPTDDKGQMLRVSSNLCLFQNEQNIKSKIANFKKFKSKPALKKKIKKKRLSKKKCGKRYSKFPKVTRCREAKSESRKINSRKL